MRQISSKFNTYVQNANIINNNDIEKIAARFIFWSFSGLGLLYVLLLGNMVSNIVERKSLEAKERVLAQEVGNMELDYLSLSNNIDLDFSHSLGFKEAKTAFATRKSLGFITSDALGNTKVTQNDL